MALCIPLPDAPPVADQSADQWHFRDDSGHEDWVFYPGYLAAMHAHYRASVWYTVQRYPAALPDAAELRDWLDQTDPRQHPSLSAAERNA